MGLTDDKWGHRGDWGISTKANRRFWSAVRADYPVNGYSLIWVNQGDNECKLNTEGHKGDCNGTGAHSHLIRRLSARLRTKGFDAKSRSCHLSFRYRTCFEQNVPWHSSNYRVQIHSKRVCDMIKNRQTNEWREEYLLKEFRRCFSFTLVL